MRKELALMRIKAGSGDFPGGPVVRSPPAIAGDMGSILGRQRFHKPQNATTEAHAP